MWKDIVIDSDAQIIISYNESSLADSFEQRICSGCHADCSSGYCWGSGSHNCQILTRSCAAQCNDRCYGTASNECCNIECAAGCTGPTNSDCLACKHYIDNGQCVANCEPVLLHNRKNILSFNPSGKYKYGIQCVKQCPPNYIASNESSACLAECETEKYLGPNGRCIDDAADCVWDEEDGLIHANNYKKLTNCTTIRGGLTILKHTFDGDVDRNIGRMKVQQLNVLNSVEAIIGYLVVNGKPSRGKFHNLSFLSNLKMIYSRGISTTNTLVEISGTDLTSLSLNSLQHIGYGDIEIVGNNNLCFADIATWKFIQVAYGSQIKISNNRDKSDCVESRQVCSKLCSNEPGCWGLGDDQCVICNDSAYQLDRKCVESCAEEVNVFADDKTRHCLPCHSQCFGGFAACTGSGPGQCSNCSQFSMSGTCVTQCFSSQYIIGVNCYDCHKYCLPSAGCTGPGNGIGSNKCNQCLKVRLAEDHYTVLECLDPESVECGIGYSSLQFNCTEMNTCLESKNYSSACIPLVLDNKNYIAVIAGVVVGGCFIIGLIIAAICLLRRQLVKAEENKLRLTARISGIMPCEELSPTNTKPDMSLLRLIKESELKRHHIIGSGAFGTVYKGFWKPESENIQIPVAIKVLQKGTAAVQSQELLAEARIMASVRHPCCTRLLAVCLASEMMLVTPLMAGSLLEYIRKHERSIGSQIMLNWCTQIARGMAYLESVGIIHRDLAARNVLVHSDTNVKITDFGLAKLVFENAEFHAEGEKMPIKWLAVECIKLRIYSHKSDVWSFGVTLWEIFTYGKRPYEGVRVTDIISLVEKGERLPQPAICTIDIYMIMIKCWLLDADCRPSFAELASELANMCRDPGRYLVIHNDALMRLPSQTSVDSDAMLREMVKQMSVDGPEEIVLAEDYVNEHLSDIRSNKRPHPPLRLVTKLDKMSEEIECQESNIIPKHLNAEKSVPTTNYEQRYSPNPCSDVTHAATNEQTMMKNFSADAKNLIVDDTAYLQPNFPLPDVYLDLTDNYLSSDAIVKSCVEDQEQLMDMSSKKNLLSRIDAVDNPEYYSQSSDKLMETSQS